MSNNVAELLDDDQVDNEEVGNETGDGTGVDHTDIDDALDGPDLGLSSNNGETDNGWPSIYRPGLQRHLIDLAVEIRTDDLDALTEEQTALLWDWMEIGSDPHNSIVGDVWFVMLPDFLEKKEPNGEVERIGLKGDSTATATGLIAVSSSGNEPPDEPPTATTGSETASNADPLGEVVDAEYQVKTDASKAMQKHLKAIFKASTYANKMRSHLEDAESQVKAAKGHEKTCLENLHAAEKELSRVIADAKSGQQKLPFGDDDDKPAATVSATATATDATKPTEETPIDVESTPASSASKSSPSPATKTPISELGVKQIKKTVGADVFNAAKEQEDPVGLSESQLDKLAEKDISTIDGLEQWMREDPFWHTRISGFGDKAIQRVISTLLFFRKHKPQPQ